MPSYGCSIAQLMYIVHVHTDRCSCQQHYDAFPELIVSQYTKNEKKINKKCVCNLGFMITSKVLNNEKSSLLRFLWDHFRGLILNALPNSRPAL